MKYNKHRILKQGKDLWVIIEPKRELTLRDENNKLLSFKTKSAALLYCKDNNLEVGEEYA